MYSNFKDYKAIDILSDEHIDAFSDFLEHYGTPRHSGRYPWGSGEKYQRSKNFKSTVSELRKQGHSNAEIAEMLGLSSSSEVVRKYSIANAEVRAAERAKAIRLREKGYGYSKIGEIMGKNESSVRSLLDEVYNERSNKTKAIADMLADDLKSGSGYIDVGLGTSNRLNVSNTKLQTAIQMLVDDGKYKVYTIPIKQVGTGEITWTKILADKNISEKEIRENSDKIGIPQHYDENGTIRKLEPPVSISSDRVFVKYAEQGGTEKDGLIELRRGVEDLSLKDAHYAQVRIAVDDTHYLKGMAMYGDDIPEGYDIVFNTNKHQGTPKIDPTGGGNEVFKKLKDRTKQEDGNPFGASIKMDDELVLAQRHYIGKDGKEHLSALNIVSEEGNWEKWSRNLASQFLSKQPISLAKKQLDYAYYDKNQEFNDILKLTNPSVKRKLLESFADDCDSAAVHLKAAAMPRQQTHVILPFPEMKDNEIFAPNYKDGTRVVLIRYPHGGKFELPELTVNNKVPSVRKALGTDIKDAVGINAKVAERLSGADFDGDTVVVIPNNKGAVKTSPALEGLKNFDPKERYPYYEGMKVMTKKQKGLEMGKVSNLITDMTLQGAPDDKIARAVRHSMVVVDAEKHKLNWKQSEIDNDIAGLKKEFQGKAAGGAYTLISRSKSPEYVESRKVLFSKKDEKGNKIVDQGIVVATGEKAYQPSGYYKSKKVVDKETGEVSYVKEPKLQKSTKMAEAKDSYDLLSSRTSPYPMEVVYADYANRLKSLGNSARKEILATQLQPQSKSARQAYAEEVSSLKIKLNNALKNKPLERKAQALANTLIRGAMDDNPNMDSDDRKKLKAEKLKVARARVGANKSDITITDREWKAIQSGAISSNTLKQILDNTDMDRVKQLATPRRENGLSSSEKALAKSMLASGFTRGEVADRIGISTSTLSKYLD